MKSTIAITGIRLHAYHGVYEQEKAVGNDYEVDVFMVVEVGKALASDHLDDTLDYFPVYKRVLAIMQERAHLIEYLAGRVVNEILAHFPQVETVKVRIGKIHPMAMPHCERTYVEMEGGRS